MIRKSLILAFVIALFSIFPLAAYTDFFYETSVDPEYVALISSIKNGEKESVVLSNYDTYINSGITPVERCRVEYHLARYYKDRNNKKKGNEHVALMKDLYNKLPADTSEFEKKVCMTEITSADYYVNKKMSVGMENSEHAKNLYNSYPEDVFCVLNEVWRLIYTPGIAGGSPRKAVRYLNDLMDKHGDQLSMIDTYSAYCAYALAYNRQSEYKKADEYFQKAFNYFTGEKDIENEYESNKEKLELYGDSSW